MIELYFFEDRLIKIELFDQNVVTRINLLR